MRSLKILIVLDFVPKYDHNSGDLRLFGILKILGKHFTSELWFAPDLFLYPENRRYIEDLQKINIKILREYNDLQSVIRNKSYEFVFFEFYRGAFPGLWLTRYFHPETITIVDSVDVHFIREEMALRHDQIPARRFRKNKRLELSVYKECDAVFVVSDLEKDALKNNSVDNNKIYVIPNIINNKDCIDYSASSKEVIFIGGFKHPPNLDGVLWFVNKIWPIILTRVNSARLTIIGSNPPDEIMRLDGKSNIHVTGYVPDTEPFLRHAAISIAPLRIGSGMKGKINEAMAYGLPVVATTVGAQGFKALSGVHIMIADEPELFAESVITLLNDWHLRESIGRKGNELNKKICSPDVVENSLLDSIESLVNRSEKNMPERRFLFRRHFFGIEYFFRKLLYLKYYDIKFKILSDYFLKRRHYRKAMRGNNG